MFYKGTLEGTLFELVKSIVTVQQLRCSSTFENIAISRVDTVQQRSCSSTFEQIAYVYTP